MEPKNNSDDSFTDSSKVKRKSVRITIAMKKEIISKYEHGFRVRDLAMEYSMAKSTISTILKNREAIKRADVAFGVKVLSKQRSPVIDEVEKLLLTWIHDKLLDGDRITEAIICERAKQLHDELLQQRPGTSADTVVFKASRGWYDNFKRRSFTYGEVRHEEAVSSDQESADECVEEFSDYVKVKTEEFFPQQKASREWAETFQRRSRPHVVAENYREDITSNQKPVDNYVHKFRDYVKTEEFLPQQVFNCDETGLFWKRLPRRTYITQEEIALPGHKPMKDRLSLLLCGNASGDFKVKPLLVYHSENPQVFRKHNVMKHKLPVMWRSNTTAWVTRQFFIEWIHEVFAPSVKKYLQEKHLPIKCLLVLDNAPAHPPGLEDELTEECDFITVRFLPSDITALIQPMDQEVISSFKKLYTKALFQRCFEVTSDTQLTLREFWRNHFNILHCLGILDKAWGQVTDRTMNLAWRKLWPDCVADEDTDNLEAESVAIVDAIVSLGESMGLEVDSADVEELVKDHRDELTSEDLEHLQNEQNNDAMEEMSSVTEEEREDVSSSLISEICRKWDELQNFVALHHPDKATVNRTINLFNDSAMSHFRNILKRRQKQISLHKTLVRQRPCKFQTECNGAKKQKQEEEEEESVAEEKLSDFFVAEDSASKQ